MFLTTITRTLYRTLWSRYPTVVNIDQDTQMTWSGTTLWLSKEGKKDIPVYYENADKIECEVNNIIHMFNENEKEETSQRMNHYLEMCEAERKRNSCQRSQLQGMIHHLEMREAEKKRNLIQ